MLTYVSFELALEELEGDYCGGGKGNINGCHAFLEEAQILVQLAHVVRTSWPSEASLGVFISLVYPCLLYTSPSPRD